MNDEKQYLFVKNTDAFTMFLSVLLNFLRILQTKNQIEIYDTNKQGRRKPALATGALWSRTRKKHSKNIHLTIHLPKSSGVCEWANEWAQWSEASSAEQANEWVVRELERVGLCIQYLHLDSWLFKTTVQWKNKKKIVSGQTLDGNIVTANGIYVGTGNQLRRHPLPSTSLRGQMINSGIDFFFDFHCLSFKSQTT